MGILLTGMGADGVKGLLKIRERGALNVAQDSNSCVVYGMLKEAVKPGPFSTPPSQPIYLLRFTLLHPLERRNAETGRRSRRRVNQSQ